MKKVFIFTLTTKDLSAVYSETAVFATRKLAEDARKDFIRKDKKGEFCFSDIDCAMLYESEEDIKSGK